MDAAMRIKELMHERGWSMYMLSKKSGLCSTTVQTMFARNTMPSITTVEAVCKAFGITMAQFFQDGDEIIVDDEQKELLREFSKLPPHQRKAILELLHSMNIET